MREEVWMVITDTPKRRWLAVPQTGNKTSTNVTNSGTISENDGTMNLNPYLGNGAVLAMATSQAAADIDEAEGGGSNGSNEHHNGISTNSPFNWRYLQKTPVEIVCSRTYVASQVLVVCSLIILMMIAYVPSLRVAFGPKVDLNATNGVLDYPDGPVYVRRTFFAFDEDQDRATQPVLAIRVLTWICVILFTLDLFARGVFCPNFFRWLRSVYTITDFILLIPFYVEFALFIYISKMPATYEGAPEMVRLFKILDVTNTLKIFIIGRLFRLLQRQRATRILLYTIRNVSVSLFMVLALVVLCALFFGTMIFFFDRAIDDIFHGFWWAFSTMATVGYGDVTPTSIPGYVIGVCCMAIGIPLTTYPAPLLIKKFLFFYGHADQLAWMRRIHTSAAAKRMTDRRDLMVKRRISRVRALLMNTVIGTDSVDRSSRRDSHKDSNSPT